ncbi:serine hydrolase-like protein [Gouania willdenowi]|uniref:Serine hydrolase-like protein n=1 Tax=Gouania willdenowi TaxID=441366 RepID=A0A8C5HC78_GOUWI|nr:serine hydrolase-like protein [Gouania willdenowi]XP_028290950.1 serine hydrolase-like protein [Gouania willdenowi]XP_028291021.1 serine hydrolase-like protein [Gouania willdenowi]
MSSTVTAEELCVAVPWGEIRGKSWGPGAGPPVLLLHGWADNCGSFDPLIPLLPKECRYVAVDLAGHGLSSHRVPGVDYSIHAYVADVHRVTEALHMTKFTIVGHSMGATIAGMFSALFPEKVNATVLLDAYGFVSTDQVDLVSTMRYGMDEMIQFERVFGKKQKLYTHEMAVERLLAGNSTLSEQSAHTLLHRGLTPVEGGFVFSRDLRVNFKHIEQQSLEQCLELQSNIQGPVLLILAESGYGLKLKEKSKAALVQGYLDRNDTVVTVPGNHHVHLNNPEVVAGLISDFLRTKVLTLQQTD